MLEAQTLHPSELSDADADCWRILAAAEPAFANPLLGPDFAQAVGRVRDDACISVFKRDGKPVGFLPYYSRPGGLARPIGAPLGDYHALVTGPAPGFNAEAALTAAGIGAYRYQGLVDPHGIFGAAEIQHEGWRIDLAGSADDYLETLRAASAKKFKNWRRLDHKLGREIGDLRVVAPDTSQAAFDLMLAWKRDQLRRSGGHAFLTPAWTRQLLQSLFETRAGAFQGLMVSLYAGDRLVAAHFGVRLGRHYHPWIASADPELDAMSPGQIFLMRAIAMMPELGLTTYDLGPSHDHYKRAYANTKVMVGQGLAAAPTRQGRAQQQWDRVWSAAGAGGDGFAARLHRRLDVIASAETSFSGRALGIVDAFAGQARRRFMESGAE